jgi:flagellar hook-associated protein 2
MGSIDVNSLVSQIMVGERQPLTKLQASEAGVQAKISSLGGVKSALSGFTDAVNSLNSASKFSTIKSTSSDSASVGISAVSTSTVGSFGLDVIQLAQNHRLRTDSFTDITTSLDPSITAGKLQIQFGTDNGTTFAVNGDKPTISIDITAANSSLGGIRDAINAKNAGVRASIVKVADNNFQLSITSTDTGASNSLKITAFDDTNTAITGATGLGKLVYDPTKTAGTGKNLTGLQTAQDASIKIDGITINRASNTISDAVNGVTLDLKKVTTTSVNMSISKDTSGASTAINGLVKAYNDLNKSLKSLTSYNAETKKGGVFQGDSSLNSITTQIRGVMSQTLGGLSSGAPENLAAIGISFQRDGSMTFDSSKLNKYLETGSADGLASLFTATGVVSSDKLRFVSATSTASASVLGVNITQAATQGKVVGSVALSGAISLGSNTSLNLTVNGNAMSVTLNTSYASLTELQSDLQSKLNSNTVLKNAGITLTASNQAGNLQLTTNTFGSSSAVAVTGGSAMSTLFGTPTSTAGLDATGTINGETLTASGQTFTTSGGVKIDYTGTATGMIGSVSFSRGYASKLSTTLANLTDSTKGIVGSKTNALNAQVKDLQKRQTALQTRLVTVEARYRQTFTQLDQSVSSMQSSSSYLTQQFNALSKSA